MLKGKKILVGVCGGIAAYKSAMLVRLLVKNGAEVKVVMTPAALRFISPLTLATLSKNPALSEFYSSDDGSWNNHVELGLWADAMVIAPATANTITKMAYGICDNLLLACFLSARCPVLVAPAMDLDMYKHPSTQANIQTLQERGTLLIPAETGELASGLSGEGRMAEPENILNFLHQHFLHAEMLKGKRILISAGPTYEAIDPVRFIGNHSTGKMGIALANHAQKMGAEVHLVCGPTTIASNPSIQRTNVVSAEEMSNAIHALFPSMDICIMAAAVADYKPAQVASEKMKKKDEPLTLVLEKTKDILGGLGKIKKPHQVLVGFALETQNELEYALGKLEKKNLDLVILNSLRTPGAGFGHDTNEVTLITKDKTIEKSQLLPKTAIAEIILEKVATLAP